MYAKSKIDWWMQLVFQGLNLVILSSIIVSWRELSQWLILGLLVGATMVNWIYFQTDYKLGDSELIIRSGPFRERIAYHDIASIRLTKSFLSSMALSIDRIEIRQKDKNFIMGTTQISPQNREHFYELLEEKIKEVSEN